MPYQKKWGLIHPKLNGHSDPVYRDGDFDGIDAEGCISVPHGPGLGVSYDWDFVAKRTVASQTYT